MRTIYSVIGFDGSKEQDAVRDRANALSARPAWVQLNQMIVSDRLFRSWLAASHQTGYAKAIVLSAQNSLCEKMIAAYRAVFRSRVSEIKK